MPVLEIEYHQQLDDWWVWVVNLPDGAAISGMRKTIKHARQDARAEVERWRQYVQIPA